MSPAALVALVVAPLLLALFSLAARRRWWLTHALGLGALVVIAGAAATAPAGQPLPLLGSAVQLEPVPRIGLVLAAGFGAAAMVYHVLAVPAAQGYTQQAALPGVLALTLVVIAVAALGIGPFAVSVVLLLVATLMVSAIMLFEESAWPVALAATGHLITATLAGTSLLVSLLLADLYRLNPAGAISVPLVAAGLTVGWGLLLGAAPFHFASTNVLSRVGPVAGTVMVAILAPVTLVMLVQALASYPWLVTDPRVNRYLLLGGLASSAFGAVMALGNSKPGRLLSYALVHDLGFVLAGLATYTRLGATGALLQIGNRALAATLLLFSLAEWQRGGRSRYLAACVGVGVLSIAGAPLTSGFVSRWTVYQAVSLEDWRFGAVLAASSAVLLLALIQAAHRWAWPGEFVAGGGGETTRSPSSREFLLLSMAAVTVLLGLFPGPVIAATRDAVQQFAFLKPI